MLRHTHREVKARGPGIRIYWRYGRGRGAIPLITFDGATLAEAEAAERDGADLLAEAYLAVKRPMPPTGTVDGMAAAYLVSNEFARLAKSTQSQWLRSLNVIRKDLGTVTRHQLEGAGGTALVIDWRDRYAVTPRTADYHCQVLRAVFKHARQRGWMTRNIMADVEALYTVNRAEVVVTATEVEEIAAAAGSAEMSWAIRFLYLTGLRRGSALLATWSDIDLDAGQMVIRTSRKRGRITQVVPITFELEELLEEIPRQAVTILTAPGGAPYRPDSVTQGFLRALKRIRSHAPDFAPGIRLHDLRGSRATEEVAKVLNSPEIRERMGWTAKKSSAPEKYVAPITALAAAKRRANKNGS